MHVLIIGGGTGGMCLAHGLKQASVSVAVYERDRTRSDGLHRYRIGINPTGNRALPQCLPPTLFATFIATCARSPRYFNVLTEKLRFTATVPLREPTDPVDSERSVSRMTLRQVLFTGMDDVVAFDKVFTHYWQHDDGTVEATFALGSSASGDVLVAVDGANSAVRRQYLPHATVKPAGIIAVGGKVPITDATKPLLPHHCFQGRSLRQAAACGDRRLRGRDGPLRVRRGGRLSSPKRLWRQRPAPQASGRPGHAGRHPHLFLSASSTASPQRAGNSSTASTPTAAVSAAVWKFVDGQEHHGGRSGGGWPDQAVPTATQPPDPGPCSATGPAGVGLVGRPDEPARARGGLESMNRNHTRGAPDGTRQADKSYRHRGAEFT